MKKRIIALILTISAALGAHSAVFAGDEISVMLDGNKIEFDVQPQIINDRTMVPMRKIFEAFGANVDWIEDTRMILASSGSKFILMQIDMPTVIIKDIKADTEQRTPLDCAPLISDGRTLVPVRAVSESLSADVQWDGESQTVYITTGKREAK